jgi:hypothetical protein
MMRRNPLRMGSIEFRFYHPEISRLSAWRAVRHSLLAGNFTPNKTLINECFLNGTGPRYQRAQFGGRRKITRGQ